MSLNKVISNIFAVLLICYSLPVASQEYANMELSEIGNMLRDNPIRHIVRRDSTTGAITHLGLNLFPQDYDYPYNAILRFIERFALHAKLLDGVERKLYMSDRKVNIDISKLSPIDSLSKLDVNSDGERFHVRWNNCVVSFPQEYNLIFGLNKKESDEEFRSSLLSYSKSFNNNDSKRTTRISIVTPRDSTSYYVKEGVSYVLHEINTNQYFVKSNDSILRPIYTEKYAAESVVNLMQQIVSSQNFTLNIQQNIYGYKKATFSIPLKVFSDYCLSLGCTTYIGIEEENKNEVKAVVVYRNEFFGYNHLLYITVPRNVIREQEGDISAKLYCYIPTHNLKQRL